MLRRIGSYQRRPECSRRDIIILVKIVGERLFVADKNRCYGRLCPSTRRS